MKSRVLRGLLIAFAALAVVPSAAAATPRVLAVEFDNDVNPVTADYVTGEIDRANREHYDAVVILLDTPGGLSDAMKDIYEKELASKVPVIVYVSPEGARAASAGVWIGQAGDILAMAPQTNIGSSTPISVGGEDIQRDLRRKVVNDAAASLRGLAKEHGRNVKWADAAVRRASNLTAREALRLNVIDTIAPTLPALLNQIDGQKTVPKGIVLHTAGAQIDEVQMSLWKRALDLLIDPNIIALMLSIGLLGIIVELWNPGLIFPGTVGAISLIVALFGLQVLPVSAAGVLLMILAAGFFGAELFLPSHGALTLAGAVCFFIGALMLFDPAGSAYQVSSKVAFAIAATLALATGLAAMKIVQARRAPVVTGQSDLIGQVGVVRQTLDPEGLVFVHGELWKARASNGAAVERGREVRVEELDDSLTLMVAPT
ncbi:MAG TPA: nodulation protein NfeD [Gaiellaceae bacterium]|nr:nodulation protein NfeD [Gaiellaceae bacterium]